jgi:(p)ppGpp synthase/HD superfamily hydrolase
MLTARFDDALQYARIAHDGQVRKGGRIPYVAHLLDVTAIVLSHGGTEDEAIGALLHDAAEDAGGRARLQDIRARFGDAVAEIVEGCSDTFDDPKPPWLTRKRDYVAHMRGDAVSTSTLLVSAADKLANVRAILEDHRSIGEEVWARFKAKKSDTLWYYRTLADLFSERLTGPRARLAKELSLAVTELQRQAGMEGPLPGPTVPDRGGAV